MRFAELIGIFAVAGVDSHPCLLTVIHADMAAGIYALAKS
jgi:hypothetical protein